MSSLLRDLFSPRKTTAPTKVKKVVGVDIGKTSIKVVEIEDRDDVLTLTTYGEIQTGPYANSPIGKVTNLSAKAEQSAVIDLFRESTVGAKTAVFAVPLASSFVTVIQLPTLEEETDVSARVQVEARKYIPIPIKDVTLDWAEIAATEKRPEYKEVLLAAIQNDTLTRLRTLMERTNLANQPTEIECFSVLRTALTASQSLSAVLDMGGSSIKLYIARDGLLEQIHRVQVGGAMATEKIAEALKIDFEEAEIRKRTDVSADITRVHSQVFERPLQECKRFMAEYESTHNASIGSVSLTGGVSLFNGIEGYVGQVLERDIEIATPFTKIAYPAFMEDVVQEIGPSFSIALGAAMRLYE